MFNEGLDWMLLFYARTSAWC